MFFREGFECRLKITIGRLTRTEFCAYSFLISHDLHNFAILKKMEENLTSVIQYISFIVYVSFDVHLELLFSISIYTHLVLYCRS